MKFRIIFKSCFTFEIYFITIKPSMKKRLLFLLLITFNTALIAQYKKASFLNKKGRTYDLGTSGHFLGGGNSTGVGFYFSYGKESNTKRLFHWFDLEYALGHNYSYSSTAYTAYGSTTPTAVIVNGKTDASLAYRYNLAFYILDNGNEDNKFLPFINASLGVVLPLMNTLNYTVTPTSIDLPAKSIIPIGGAYTAGIGAGATYYVTKSFGVKLNATFYGVLSKESNGNNGYDYFKTLPNHVAVSIGAHWLLDRDND